MDKEQKYYGDDRCRAGHGSVSSGDRLLVIDFNDQHHVIRREYGDRQLKVAPLLEWLPPADAKMSFAKAPSYKVVENFDRMLKHRGFEDRYYMFGKPSNFDCGAWLACRVLDWCMMYEPKEVVLVTAHYSTPDLIVTIGGMNIKATWVGFGTSQPIPTHCLDPTPMADQIAFTDRAEGTTQ